MKHCLRRAICGLIFTAAHFGTFGLHAAERGEASEALTDNTNEFLSDPARTGSLVGSILASSAVANPLAPLLGSVAGFMIGKKFGLDSRENNAAFRNNFARRKLTPTSNLELPGLSGLSGKAAQASEHTVLLGIPVTSSSRNQTEVIEPVERALATEVPSLTGQSVPAEPGRHTVSQYYHAGVAEQGVAEPTITLAPDRSSIPDFYGPESSDEPVEVTRTLESGYGSVMQRQLAHQCAGVSTDEPMPPACYYFFQ